MPNESEDNTVWVSMGAVKALSEPTFIIKINDNLHYVTKALWEYDMTKAVGDPAKVAGCNLIAAQFASGAATGPTHEAVPKPPPGVGGPAIQTNSD